MKLLNKIFSVKYSPDYRHKVFTILGMKIKTLAKQNITDKDRKEYIDYVLNMPQEYFAAMYVCFTILD